MRGREEERVERRRGEPGMRGGEGGGEPGMRGGEEERVEENQE